MGQRADRALLAIAGESAFGQLRRSYYLHHRLESVSSVLAANSKDLSRSNGFEPSQGFRHARQKIFECDRFRAENDDGDFPPTQILLVLKTSIHGQQDVKSSTLGCRKKFTILESTETGVARGLALVPS